MMAPPATLRLPEVTKLPPVTVPLTPNALVVLLNVIPEVALATPESLNNT